MSNLKTKQKRFVLASLLAALSGACLLFGALTLNDTQIKQAAGEIAIEMADDLSAEYNASLPKTERRRKGLRPYNTPTVRRRGKRR